jgi:hypothetical protein
MKSRNLSSKKFYKIGHSRQSYKTIFFLAQAKLARAFIYCKLLQTSLTFAVKTGRGEQLKGASHASRF